MPVFLCSIVPRVSHVKLLTSRALAATCVLEIDAFAQCAEIDPSGRSDHNHPAHKEIQCGHLRRRSDACVEQVRLEHARTRTTSSRMIHKVTVS